MYIINSNFNLIKQIGDLSTSRIQALKSALNEDFPEIIQPNPQTIIFKRGVKALVVSPEQIVYLTQGVEVGDLNLEQISSLLTRTNEILGLSDSAIIQLRLELSESTIENLLEKSKSLLTEAAGLLDAYGIGYRFMVTNSNFHGDVHIEPYIKDNQKVYYNLVLESHGQKSIGELNDLLNEMITFGIRNSKEAAKNIFSL